MFVWMLTVAYIESNIFAALNRESFSVELMLLRNRKHFYKFSRLNAEP